MVSLTRDYFSSLPPELIAWIFDIAYPLGEPSPTGPLSKRLLPYYHQGLYRTFTLFFLADTKRPKASLPNRTHVSCLPNLRNLPGAANLVRALRLQSIMTDRACSTKTYKELEVLLASIPRLGHLEAGLHASEGIQEWLYNLGDKEKIRRLSWEGNLIDPINWSHLTHLKFTTSNFKWTREENIAEFSYSLSPLANLPALKSLHLTRWLSSSPDDHPQIDPDFTLSHLETLTIEGRDSLEPSIAVDILNHCPSLLHLDLLGHHPHLIMEEVQLDRLDTTFFSLVPLLSPSLKSLRISCRGWRTLLRGASLSFSDLSPSFVHLINLEHLRLGINCSTFDQLAHTLPKLRSLHLARPSPKELAQLGRLIQSAPHPSLCQVTIDLARSDHSTDLAILGRRGKLLISTPENADQFAKEPGENDGWIASTEELELIEGELREFRRMAEDKGICVTGQAVEALQVRDDFVAEGVRRERHNFRCFEERRARKEEFKAEGILRLSGGN